MTPPSWLRNLGVGEAPGLHVTLKTDVPPADEVAIAPVLRGAVHALAGVLVQQVHERAVAGIGQPLVLLGLREDAEVRSEPSQSGAVGLLPADHRPVELPFRPAEGPLDAGAPGQLLEAPERE